MPACGKNKPMLVHIPPPVLERLDTIAEVEDRSRSSLVRRILQDWVESLPPQSTAR